GHYAASSNAARAQWHSGIRATDGDDGPSESRKPRPGAGDGNPAQEEGEEAMVVVAAVPQGCVSGCFKTPPPHPLPEAERGSRSFFSPSPPRGGGRGEGLVRWGI